MDVILVLPVLNYSGLKLEDMDFINTNIPEVVLIKPEVFTDPRGEFLETYRLVEFSNAGIETGFVQDNYAGSKLGVLRGLHYQIQKSQGKLVRVINGEIFDVAVDLRKSSPTFGSYVGIRLDDKDKKMLWIPPGFAHGYYVMSDWAEVEYKVTEYYAPEFERTIIWNDPKLKIDWPLLEDGHPILSEKDLEAQEFHDADLYE